MLTIHSLKELDDYFLKKSERQAGVFFNRLFFYNEEIEKFLQQYAVLATKGGVYIQNKLQNPVESNLNYYGEIMGEAFVFEAEFIQTSLQKWLPRLQIGLREDIANSIFINLQEMQQEGKNENILKNAYIKYMCWLYYKFESILTKTQQEEIPKILYEGSQITKHELSMLSIVARCGCDVVLLELQGDEGYQKQDTKNHFSSPYTQGTRGNFPEGFSIRNLINPPPPRATVPSSQPSFSQQPFGTAPQRPPSQSSQQQSSQQAPPQRRFTAKSAFAHHAQNGQRTNTWCSGDILKDILKPVEKRKAEENCYYNAFFRWVGVENRVSYENELYQFYLKLKAEQRNICIIEEDIKMLSPMEIEAVGRGNYTNIDDLILDMSKKFPSIGNLQLQKILESAFICLMSEEAEKEGITLNRLMNQAVHVIGWFKRYQKELYVAESMKKPAVFILLGGCRDEKKALFVRFLAKLPIDVLILCPNLEKNLCVLQDKLLFEKIEEQSLVVSKFPKDATDIKAGTIAFHAEQDLNAMIYEDTGIYRNYQYQKASTLTLQTMYEEIELLWGQNGQFRPNFSEVQNQIILPVIFAKLSGVQNGNVRQYWAYIKNLMVDDVYVIKKAPFFVDYEATSLKPKVRNLCINGNLQREQIKNHAFYTYGYLREDMQDYILDKMQLLIDRKIIKGTGTTETNSAIMATILQLNRDIVRLLQKFDFTKNIPKIISIDTTESIYSLEDAILFSFLNLIGFDILICTPTGYQNIEKYFEKPIITQHQIGEYLYDLNVPKFDSIIPTSIQPTQALSSLKDKFFRR